jgi:hypothetical protein
MSKLFIGALISAIPILNFAWTGYTVDIFRNVSKRVSTPLPDWSDFGDKFLKGLQIWAAGIIYLLPVIILLCTPIGYLGVQASLDLSDLQDSLILAFTGIGIALLSVWYFFMFCY